MKKVSTPDLPALRSMLSEFERMRDELLAAVVDEEIRSGQPDQDHFAYPTSCKAARIRVGRLDGSIADLRRRIADIELAA